MEPSFDFDPRFLHPFCMIVAGPSQCGKTNFVVDLLVNVKEKINPPVLKILYCYSVWQEYYDFLKQRFPSIDFNEGLPELSEIANFKDMIIVLDDLMVDCIDNKKILHLFTVGSHHNRISVIFLTQNIFCKGKFSRTLSLNSNYMILFRNPRDPSQISCLARQIFPQNTKYFMDAFNDAVNSKVYGYLIVDLKQETPKMLRLRSLMDDQIIVYKKK